METTLRGGDIGKKVPRKADDLLEDNSEKSNNGRVLSEFFKAVYIKE